MSGNFVYLLPKSYVLFSLITIPHNLLSSSPKTFRIPAEKFDSRKDNNIYKLLSDDNIINQYIKWKYKNKQDLT